MGSEYPPELPLLRPTGLSIWRKHDHFNIEGTQGHGGSEQEGDRWGCPTSENRSSDLESAFRMSRPALSGSGCGTFLRRISQAGQTLRSDRVRNKQKPPPVTFNPFAGRHRMVRLCTRTVARSLFGCQLRRHPAPIAEQHRCGW